MSEWGTFSGRKGSEGKTGNHHYTACDEKIEAAHLSIPMQFLTPRNDLDLYFVWYFVVNKNVNCCTNAAASPFQAVRSLRSPTSYVPRLQSRHCITPRLWRFALFALLIHIFCCTFYAKRCCFSGPWRSCCRSTQILCIYYVMPWMSNAMLRFLLYSVTKCIGKETKTLVKCVAWPNLLSFFYLQVLSALINSLWLSVIELLSKEL